MRWARVWTISLWAWAFVGQGPAAAGGPGQANLSDDQGAGPRSADQPQVQIKHLGPTRIIFLEHQGPYWQLGRLFSQVAEFMAAHNQPGPMFGRYLDDPQKVEIAKLRAEVGFLASGEVQAPDPYRTELLQPRIVASLVIEGHYGQAPASYPKVFAWIKEHGYLPEQAVTEVYPVSSDDASSGQHTTEIQVVLVGAAEQRGPGTAAPADQGPGKGTAGFESFARRLLPPQESFPETLRDWMAQVVLRIEALQRAAADAAGGGSALDAYAGPILARSSWLLEGARARCDVEPPAGGPEAVALADAPRLLHRLDALLVNLTCGRVGPDEALGQLVELTAGIPRLVAQAARQRQRE